RSVQRWLGCPSYARWFTWPGSEVSWDDNLRDLAAALGEVHAGLPPGVRISLEPHPKQVVYDAETMRQLLDMAGFDIGVCYDPANVRATCADPIAFLDVI